MILGVEPTATRDEITSSYKKLARKIHPDHNRDPGATAAFQKCAKTQTQKLNEAYVKLTDAEQRRKYDLRHPFRSQSRFSPQPARTSFPYHFHQPEKQNRAAPPTERASRLYAYSQPGEKYDPRPRAAQTSGWGPAFTPQSNTSSVETQITEIQTSKQERGKRWSAEMNRAMDSISTLERENKELRMNMYTFLCMMTATESYAMHRRRAGIFEIDEEEARNEITLRQITRDGSIKEAQYLSKCADLEQTRHRVNAMIAEKDALDRADDRKIEELRNGMHARGARQRGEGGHRWWDN
ncbi:hypothetical protein ACMFMG_009501 [Clarireedia jacksonii]